MAQGNATKDTLKFRDFSILFQNSSESSIQNRVKLILNKVLFYFMLDIFVFFSFFC